MLVGEVMTESVVTAAPDASVQEVAELMRERNVGSVVLVDGRRARSASSPTGTSRCRSSPPARAGSDRAREHASSPVITAEPDMEVEEAGELMVRHGVRRLVVVSGGSLAGVVALDDLASRGLRPELSRAGYASRAAGLLLPRSRRLTTASANARITGCARVPSPASSGWKSVPRKNGWSGELQRARRAVLVVGAEDHAGALRACSM